MRYKMLGNATMGGILLLATAGAGTASYYVVNQRHETRALLESKWAAQVTDIQKALVGYYRDNNAWPVALSDLSAGYYAGDLSAGPTGAGVIGQPSADGNSYILTLSTTGESLASTMAGLTSGTSNGINFSVVQRKPSQSDIYNDYLMRTTDEAFAGKTTDDRNVLETDIQGGNQNIVGLDKVTATSAKADNLVAQDVTVDTVNISKQIDMAGASIDVDGGTVSLNASKVVTNSDVALNGDAAFVGHNIEGVDSLNTNTADLSTMSADSGSFGSLKVTDLHAQDGKLNSASAETGTVTSVSGDTLEYGVGSIGQMNGSTLDFPQGTVGQVKGNTAKSGSASFTGQAVTSGLDVLGDGAANQLTVGGDINANSYVSTTVQGDGAQFNELQSDGITASSAEFGDLVANSLVKAKSVHAESGSAKSVNADSASFNLMEGQSLNYETGTISTVKGDSVTFTSGNVGSLSGDKLSFQSGTISRTTAREATLNKAASGTLDVSGNTVMNGVTAKSADVGSGHFSNGAFDSLTAKNGVLDSVNVSQVGTVNAVNAGTMVGSSATINNGDIGSLRGSGLHYSNGAVETLNFTTASGDAGDIDTLHTTQLSSGNTVVTTAKIGSGNTTGAVIAGAVTAGSLGVSGKLTTGQLQSSSSSLGTATGSSMGVSGTLTTGNATASTLDFNSGSIPSLNATAANYTSYTANSFKGGSFRASDDFYTSKSSVNKNYYLINQSQQQLDNCMYVTGYCLAKPPVISNISCPDCFKSDTRENFSATVTATISECQRGCTYSWSFSKVSGSCSSGTIAKGGSKTVSCTVSGTLQAQQGLKDVVTLTAVNSKASSFSAAKSVNVDWYNNQNPFNLAMSFGLVCSPASCVGSGHGTGGGSFSVRGAPTIEGKRDGEWGSTSCPSCTWTYTEVSNSCGSSSFSSGMITLSKSVGGHSSGSCQAKFNVTVTGDGQSATKQLSMSLDWEFCGVAAEC